MESKIEWELRRKPFKDYSTHRQRSFFQESSQPHLASSLAGGQNIQDWKEGTVGRFCTPKTRAGARIGAIKSKSSNLVDKITSFAGYPSTQIVLPYLNLYLRLQAEDGLISSRAESNLLMWSAIRLRTAATRGRML